MGQNLHFLLRGASMLNVKTASVSAMCRVGEGFKSNIEV